MAGTGSGDGNAPVGHEIGPLASLPDGGARGFRIPSERHGEQRILVLRRGDRALAYLNRCPHRGTPLDWAPDSFFDRAGRHLVCATHGARFRPDDGVCVAGPCVGDALARVPLVVRDGRMFVRDD